MEKIRDLLEEYKKRAEKLMQEHPDDKDANLINLENQMADASGLPEGDRLELRGYMAEYRRQKTTGYEAGAQNPRITRPDSGPRKE